MWHHTKQGDRYVTVVIDLTPVRHRSGPAQLLDVLSGRSKKAIQDPARRLGRVLAWAGRGGSHGTASPGPESAAGEELPQARAVMNPFHVVSLTSGKLDQCRRRIQRAITGRRGQAGDRLYRAGAPYTPGPTCSPTPRPSAWRTSSLMIATLRSRPPGASTSVSSRPTGSRDPGLGKHLMQRLIDSLRQAVPDGPEEIQTLAKTLTERAPGLLDVFRTVLVCASGCLR